MFLLFDVSILEHPFNVLVGFLLGGVAVQLLGSLDDEICGLFPFFRNQAILSRGYVEAVLINLMRARAEHGYRNTRLR
jgi:hypothetical protein